MRPYSVDHDTAVAALGEQLTGFVGAAESYDDLDLLGPSLCHGWSRLDLLVHVRLGIEEMAAVCAARVDAEPDHDAASYWRSFAEDDDDPVPHILWTRRTASAYARPGDVFRHLRAVVGLAEVALPAMPDHPVLFQGKVMTSGDFLATWVVELAVHQLDLGPGSGSPTPASLAVVRRTVEAVADLDLPATWDDERAALVALGRTPVPDEAAHLRDLLPVSL